jgi:hypothetical protein
MVFGVGFEPEFERLVEKECIAVDLNTDLGCEVGK